MRTEETPLFDALAIDRGFQCQECIDAGWPFGMFSCWGCC